MTTARAPIRVRSAPRRRLLLTVLLAISFAAIAAAITPAAAHTMAGAARSCGDVTGDTWTIPGSGEPSGNAYVVLAENIPCSQARTIGAYMALGGAGFKGWKCVRHKHFNGDCKRFARRRNPRTRQVVGWYPDIGRPSGP
jgi:hypothetical protein